MDNETQIEEAALNKLKTNIEQSIKKSFKPTDLKMLQTDW